MNNYDLEKLFKMNPTLLHKKINRYTIRSLLSPLTPEEIGELIVDCGIGFMEETKDHLALHIENILKMLRKHN